MPDSVQRAVYVVDDDAAVRDALEMLLRSAEFEVETYQSGPAFLASAAALRPGCVLLDVRMPEMSGLELQRELTARRILLPVVVMTGHGDISVAVEAMKAGAVDFVEKPFDEEQLLGLIEAALARAATTYRKAQEAAEAAALVDGLSQRERDVLDGLIAGRSNKQIAFDLGISPRTIEIYRANMMEKLRARTVSEAVRIAIVASLSNRGED